jgi:hypothetical protein
MGYNPQHLLGPTGQPFVANEAPYTRRSIMPLGNTDGGYGVGYVNYVDFVMRQSFTLPFTPIRYRFRIRNNDVTSNTTHSGAYNMTGIYVGKPASSGLTVWNGSFASAPTSVSTATPGSPIVIDSGATGAEYVGPWITSPLPSPNQAFAVSLGFNASSALFNEAIAGPSLMWQSATGTAVSANVGVTANGSIGGTPETGWGALDIRIEWEYIGNNPIGFFVGTSQEAGSINGGAGPWGNVGPDERWPEMAGLRLGHAVINGGIPGATAATWAGTPSSSLCYQRFFDTTYPTLTWPGGCTPDYAVISLGINDAYTLVTLATFQTNIAAIVANLNSLGIYKIFICTVAPGAATAGFSSGALQAARTHAGSPYTTVVLLGDVNNAAQVLPNTGYPGPATLWTSTTGFWLGIPELGTLNGITSNTVPYALTSAAGAVTGNLTLTVPSFTVPSGFDSQVGDPCLGGNEGYRKLYNHWLRQHVLGTVGTLDLSTISEGAGYISQYASALNTSDNYQGGRVKAEWYGATSGLHPADPSMYEAWANAISPQLIGI